MKHDSEYTLLDWLGFSRVPKYWNAPTLGLIIAIVMSIILLVTLLAGFAILIQLWFFVFNTSANGSFEPARNLSLTLAGLFGAPFVVWQVWLAQRRADNADEGLITDRINVAAASLGADKTVKAIEDGKEYTRPNIEVRVGAILALERIAKRSPDVHCQIMEILCSYIRENTKEDREKPREDIQLALTVIGRRSDRQRAMERDGLIDLGHTKLSGADLRKAQLSNAWLNDTKLQGAYLSGAELQGAYLSGAELQGAYLMRAKLQGAHLSGAKLDWADLWRAELQGANLVNADLQNVRCLGDAFLHGALVQALDFNTIPIAAEQVQGVFGDASTIPPDGMERPAFWPEVMLDPVNCVKEWKKWKADPDRYAFDPTKYGDKYRD